MSTTFTYVDVTRVSPPRGSAAGGRSVVITGFGFDLATGVKFGGTSVTSFTIDSNTQITCTIPQHASGVVDVEVLGVTTGEGLFTYVLPSETRFPPPPVLNSPEGQQMVNWFTEIVRRFEKAVQVFPENIIGVLSESQIPELPWTRIDKTGSSLADLETRSASELTTGILRQANGGTGRADAFKYAPGSFSIADGEFVIIADHLTLTGFDTVTISGTGSLRIL